MPRMQHLSVVKFFMIISGTWRVPLNTSSPTKQNFYNIYSVIMQVYFCVFVLCAFIELPLVWNEDVNKVSESIGITILCVMVIIKCFICQKKKVRDIFAYILEKEKHLNDLGKENLEVYTANATYSQYISILVTIYSSMCGFTLILTKFVVYVQLKNAAARNNATETHIEPPLPYIVWRPIDEKTHYISAFILDSVSATIGCTFNTVTQLMFISIMTFLIGQLKILQNQFIHFGNVNEDRVATTEEFETLRQLIMDHKLIITLVEDLDESMKFPMLLEFTINSVQITSLLFQLLTIDVDPILIFRITYSSLMVVQIFLLAWHANEIKEQSMYISEAIYNSGWYEFNLKFQRILHIVMVRAQRPLTLSIGPFFILTNDTAVTSMKAAYSYLTILNGKYSNR